MADSSRSTRSWRLCDECDHDHADRNVPYRRTVSVLPGMRPRTDPRSAQRSVDQTRSRSGQGRDRLRHRVLRTLRPVLRYVCFPRSSRAFDDLRDRDQACQPRSRCCRDHGRWWNRDRRNPSHLGRPTQHRDHCDRDEQPELRNDGWPTLNNNTGGWHHFDDAARQPRASARHLRDGRSKRCRIRLPGIILRQRSRR